MKEPKLAGALGKDHILNPPVTLREFLEDCEAYVCIAAASSFVYIGEASHFLHGDNQLVDFWYIRQKDRTYFNAHQLWENKGGNGPEPKRKEHVPFLDRRVTKYWSRKLPGEPPMWIIQIDGSETGELWLLSEVPDFMYKIWKAKVEEQNAYSQS